MVRMTRPIPRVGYPGSCARITRCGITISVIRRHRDPDGPSRSPRPWPHCSRRGLRADRLTISCSPAGPAAVAQRRLLHPRMAEAYEHGGGGTHSAVPVHDLRHTHVAWL